MRSYQILKQSAAASLAAAFAVFGADYTAHAADGWSANDDYALLLQLRVGNLAIEGDIRGYNTDLGVCVDLGDVIQSLDMPIRLDKKSRRATGWLFSEDQTFTIDRDSNLVQNTNISEKLVVGDIYDTPEGWCVDTKSLSRWFGIELSADPYNMVLKLDSDEPLPFIQAIERRSRAARLRPSKKAFDLAQLPQADMPYSAWRTPSVDMVVNFQFENAPNGNSRTDVRYELFASGEVAGASVDVRLASDRSAKPASLRVRAYRYDPDGGLLGPLRATKIAIGDVETGSGGLAGRSGIGRGAYISNKPHNRPTSFSKTTLRGTLPAGWDAELYRNDQLIAFQSGGTNGRYEFFDINLLYGDNDFEVVLYGPQGQIRREASSLPIGMQSITPGKAHYWASVIEQGRDLLEFGPDVRDPLTGWRWGVGVERGIDTRTMAAFTAQSMVIDGRRNNFVEMNLRRALGPMLVELSAAQSFGRGRAYRAQALGKIGKINFEARTLRIEGDFESDVVDPYIRGEHELRFNTSLKLGKVSVPLQLGARHEIWRDGTKVNEWLLRGSLVGRGIALTAEIGQLKTIRPNGQSGVDDGTRLQLLANTRIAGINLRGETRFRLSGLRKGFVSASLVGEKSISQRSDLRAQIEHSALLGRTDFRLGYIREFERFSLQAEGSLGSDGTIGLGLSLAFSMGPNPVNGGIRFSKGKLARTGQATVTVFRDENGDGLRSPGEEAIEDIAIAAGNNIGEGLTDKSGTAIVEGLRPFVPVLITIDTESLPDPFLQPGGRGIVVTPRPGVAVNVELPLAPTGEIEGVVHGLAGTPRSGIEIELVNPHGEVVARTLSEYDGFFLFDKVLYGRYMLRLSAASAQAIGAAQHVASQVELTRDNTLTRLGVIKLRPKTVAAGGGNTATLLTSAP